MGPLLPRLSPLCKARSWRCLLLGMRLQLQQLRGGGGRGAAKVGAWAWHSRCAHCDEAGVHCFTVTLGRAVVWKLQGGASALARASHADSCRRSPWSWTPRRTPHPGRRWVLWAQQRQPQRQRSSKALTRLRCLMRQSLGCLTLQRLERSQEGSSLRAHTAILEEPGQLGTVLRLVQKGVPQEDRFGDVADPTAQGWRQQIF